MAMSKYDEYVKVWRRWQSMMKMAMDYDEDVNEYDEDVEVWRRYQRSMMKMGTKSELFVVGWLMMDDTGLSDTNRRSGTQFR